MRTQDPSTRSAGLAVTATTLVTLVAMVAGTVAVAGGVPAAGRPGRIVHMEVVASLGEGPAARAVAAVMAVAARDLLVRTATPALLTTAGIPVTEFARGSIPRPSGWDPTPIVSLLLNEQVLDLPPPRG